ncbi:hypothetical protein Vretifemale_18694 [Volvox reticuliferus]|uniref:Uncharacterized protein n=1 Tax=Volvox reticuliferus TaxID=1737510 RepID=A0A8J4D015_9CHLO|nr:hypothetical protein Vretifemale_18694 [Volvox reticuliferus]
MLVDITSAHDLSACVYLLLVLSIRHVAIEVFQIIIEVAVEAVVRGAREVPPPKAPASGVGVGGGGGIATTNEGNGQQCVYGIYNHETFSGSVSYTRQRARTQTRKFHDQELVVAAQRGGVRGEGGGED